MVFLIISLFITVFFVWGVIVHGCVYSLWFPLKDDIKIIILKKIYVERQRDPSYRGL